MPGANNGNGHEKPDPLDVPKRKWKREEVFPVRIPWESVQAEAKKLGEDWSKDKCLRWLKDGKQFLVRAHEKNLPEVVGMVMKFMSGEKGQLDKPPKPGSGRIWTP